MLTDTLIRFKLAAEDADLATAVLSEAGLDRPPHTLTAASFRGNIATRNSGSAPTLFHVDVRFSDPAVAADLAERLAKRIIAVTAREQQLASTRTRDSARSELVGAEQRLTEARGALIEFTRQNRVEPNREVQQNLDAQRRELSQLQSQIASERARLRVTEEQLAKTLPTLLLRQPVMRSPAPTDLNESATRVTGDTAEFLNPVHSSLSQTLVQTRINLAGLETRQRFLEDAVRAGRNFDSYAISENDLRLTELRSRLSLAQRVVADLLEASLRPAATGSPSIQAPAPPRQISPDPQSSALSGLGLGLLIAIAAVLIFDRKLLGAGHHE
jgi:hypothetical protein